MANKPPEKGQWPHPPLEVVRFCNQFLQLESVLDFPGPFQLRQEAVQEQIYERIFADGALQYPPPQRYQLKVLKDLIQRIESSIEDWEEHGVSESLVSCFSQLLVSPQPTETVATLQKCYITYCLSALETAALSARRLTLLESRSVISAGGTTGHRTWEAALHLGQYLCQNPSLVKGKNVLELGAGTGYLSILCAKHLEAAHCLATDGSDDVIQNLPDNLFVNGLQGAGSVAIMDLKWGHGLLGTEEAEWNGGRKVDVVLGADITYDTRVIPALVSTLKDLILIHSEVEIVISATERNQVTYDAFRSMCSISGFDVQDVEFPVAPRSEQVGPFYSDKVPIHICRVRRKEV